MKDKPEWHNVHGIKDHELYGMNADVMNFVDFSHILLPFQDDAALGTSTFVRAVPHKLPDPSVLHPLYPISYPLLDNQVAAAFFGIDGDGGDKDDTVDNVFPQGVDARHVHPGGNGRDGQNADQRPQGGAFPTGEECTAQRHGGNRHHVEVVADSRDGALELVGVHNAADGRTDTAENEGADFC